MPKAPMSRRPWITSSGIFPSRSIRSLSTRSRRKRSSRSMNSRARSRSAGSGAGKGCTRSSRNDPSNSSRTKLGACHSFSRAASATSRASCSEARGWDDRDGGVSTSVMGGCSGGGGGRALEAPEAVQHEPDHVALAPLEIGGLLERDADGGCHGLGVDEMEPAECDDAEEKLGRVARRCVVEAELGADRRERLLAGREVLPDRGAPAAERPALDQANEVGTGGEKVEVVGDGAGQNGLWGLLAGQGAGSAGSDRLPYLLVAALQDGVVELLLGAEEVTRCAPRDPCRRPHLAQARGLVTLFSK